MSKWTSPISAIGSDGNINAINAIIATMRALARLLESQQDIENMTKRARTAPSYDAAVAVVEEWFPVMRDED